MNIVRRRHFFNFISDLLPGDGARVSKIRSALLRWAGCQVGKNAKIGQYVHVFGTGTIEIGDDCWIASGVFLQTSGLIRVGNRTEILYRTLLTSNGGSNVIIGNDCRIAHMVSIKTSCHKIEPLSPCIGGTEQFKDIVIDDGCWICAGAIILPGAHVGRKNVVAAGAVVKENVITEDLVLLAGIPAVRKKIYKEVQNV